MNPEQSANTSAELPVPSLAEPLDNDSPPPDIDSPQMDNDSPPPPQLQLRDAESKRKRKSSHPTARSSKSVSSKKLRKTKKAAATTHQQGSSENPMPPVEDEHLQQGPSSSHQMIPPLQDPPAAVKSSDKKKKDRKPKNPVRRASPPVSETTNNNFRESIRQFIQKQGSRLKKPRKLLPKSCGIRIMPLHEQLNELCKLLQAKPPSMQTRNAEKVENSELIATYTQEDCSALFIRNAAKLDGWHNPIAPSIMSLSGSDFISTVFGAESVNANNEKSQVFARYYNQKVSF